MREFESAVANRGRDDYDQRSDQEIFRDSIMQVQRRNMLREGLLAQQTGRLTPQQSAQLPVLGFPSSSQVSGSGAALPNQFGVQMENGVAASGGEEQISAFDDAMRAKYEDLPFGITTDQNGGLVIQHNELGAFPGLMVSGYDLPVAISSSPQDEEMFKRAGIPFVKPKNPDQVINQHVDVQERDDGIEEFDINSGTQEARENVAKRAKEQFENAQSFAEDMAEYQSAFDAENAKQKQHSGSFADPQFLIDQGIVRPEKDQTKTGMYDKAVTARNADIQSEYDQEYAEIQRQINEEGLPKSEADIDIRELQKDFDERKSKPMTEQEFMATIGDEAVAEELSRLQQVHEQEQRVSAQVRRKQKNDYGPEFTQAYSRQSTDGSWTYTIRSSPSTFEARPLRSVALGTGAARFPLAEQPSDMAHAAFDIPIVVRTSDGEVMQTVIPSAPFKAATAEMNKATTVIDGVKVDRLAEATVNVANLIQQFYPGEMTRQQLQEATEQMMRRHGYAEDSDFGG